LIFSQQERFIANAQMIKQILAELDQNNTKFETIIKQVKSKEVYESAKK
jgi:hypothetical protein